MKIVLRIFNVIIMALSVAAAVFLFMPPSFSFKARVTLDVATFSKFVPETQYTNDIDVVNLLGTDSIDLPLKLEFSGINDIADMKDGNHDKINANIIDNNLTTMVGLLHEPVDLITEFSIRANIKKIVSEQVYHYVDQAFEDFKTNNPSSASVTSNYTTESILDEVGIDDAYYTKFSNELYDAANKEGATLDSTNEVLFEQINEALVRAKRSGVVDTSGFGESSKEGIKNSLEGVFKSLNLVNDDGSLKPIGQLSYMYLSDYLKKELTGTADAAEIEQKPGESIPDYADRLVGIYVTNKLPDMFYTVTGYVCLGLFIALFVFAGIWSLLFVITLIKTFTKKPWTIFGFWFWLVGFIQLILGFGLTALAKFALTKVDISQFGLPISKLLVSIKTYAFIPSFMFIACIVVGIVYGVLKGMAKSSAKSN